MFVLEVVIFYINPILLLIWSNQKRESGQNTPLELGLVFTETVEAVNNPKEDGVKRRT